MANTNPSAETRKKLSESHKGKTLSKGTRAKISKSLTGKKLTEEHKANIRKGLKGKHFARGSKKGSKKSEETRRRMSEAKKRESLSKEYRQKMRESMRGRSVFGFTGTTYKSKNQKPWTRVWRSQISYNKKVRALGQFEDPLSCEIVHDLILEEIIDGELLLLCRKD